MAIHPMFTYIDIIAVATGLLVLAIIIADLRR